MSARGTKSKQPIVGDSTFENTPTPPPPTWPYYLGATSSFPSSGSVCQPHQAGSELCPAFLWFFSGGRRTGRVVSGPGQGTNLPPLWHVPVVGWV
jgi:hypothetical protein